MKVLMLASVGDSLVRIRGHLLQEWVQQGHQVLVSAPEQDDRLIHRLKEWGISYRPISLERTGMNPYLDLKYLWNLIRWLRSEKPDLLFCSAIKPVIFGSIAGWVTRIPRMVSLITGLGYSFMEGGQTQKWIQRLVTPLYRFALSKNEMVFFQNREDRDLFLDLGLIQSDCQTRVLPGSGVDLDEFPEAPVVEDPVVFLMIARLLRDKGVREYVEAVRLLRKRCLQAKFWLVGPFDSNPASLAPEEVAKWQQEGVVEYFGPTDDVRPYLRQASVFVLPSYREGVPRTVLEAMAMGRPIVTTDAPGCRDTVVEGENGFLVPTKDSQRLAEAMERFIQDRTLIRKWGRSSRELVKREFDIRKVNRIIQVELGLTTA